MKAVMQWVDRVIEMVAVLAFAASSFLILLNVFNRYVILDWMRNAAKTWTAFDPAYRFFRDGLGSWSVMADEVPGYLLVWIAFLGSYLVLRREGHISFDMILDALPPAISKWIKSINLALIAAFMIMLLVQSIRMIQVSGRTEIETAEIAQGWFMAILPIAAILFLLVLLTHLLKQFQNRQD